ncbi:MAG TPA: AI-2E family transporter, partial [Ktedonobacterales bacterium]|nr:AI-2E family transporter [Ktedonobacterales bacterium]
FLTILADAFLVIVISYYMMLDGDRLIERLVQRLPPAWEPDIRLFQRNVDQIFGGFLRAELIIGLVYAAFTWVGLMILGQGNGLPVALVTGLIMLLPLIGPYLAIIPPLMLIVLQTPTDQVVVKLIIMLIVLVLAQQVSFRVLAPRIFSAAMGVPPLVLFAGLLVGAKIGGIWGAFFAAPIISVAYATIDVFYARFQATSRLFRPSQSVRGTASTQPGPSPAYEAGADEAGMPEANAQTNGVSGAFSESIGQPVAIGAPEERNAEENTHVAN